METVDIRGWIVAFLQSELKRGNILFTTSIVIDLLDALKVRPTSQGAVWDSLTILARFDVVRDALDTLKKKRLVRTFTAKNIRYYIDNRLPECREHVLKNILRRRVATNRY